MSGRPKIFNEYDVVNKAAEVFWENGYEASSSEDLLKAMGIGKGSFYLFFKGGKKELYEKALRQFADNLLKGLKGEIEKSKDPILYLKEFFLSLSSLSDSNDAKGCFMGNALAEMSAKDEFTRRQVSKLLVDLEVIFTEAIQRGQQNNKYSFKASPELLGKHLLNLWNGIHLTRRMPSEKASLKELIQLNLELLN
ncbi:TetR/AcrR family transcriptional regulator [Flavobacterium sp.]|uniref:TetR/AcrR family transcriptional regulator n=1 Tax=Flavobacterium sp. TaxID=239 RepID=UPI0039E68C96